MQKKIVKLKIVIFSEISCIWNMFLTIEDQKKADDLFFHPQALCKNCNSYNPLLTP